MNIKNISNIKSLFLDNQSTKQTIFKNTFWLMLSEGISKGLLFFLTIWIARYLGAEGFGIFSFAFAFVALFAVLADFGLSTLTIREVARDKFLAKKYIDNIAVIKLILGLITFGLILIIVQFLGKAPEVKTLVYLAGIWIIIQSFTQFFQSIFRAFEKMQYEALSKIIYSIFLFSIAGVVLWQNLGIKLLVQSYIYAALIAFIITLILVRKNFTKFWTEIDFGFWKGLLKEAWPFLLSGIFISIYCYIDTIMLSVMKNDEVVGWYNAVYKIIWFLLFLPTSLTYSIFPAISKQFILSRAKFKNTLSNFARLMIVFGLPLSVGGTILGPRIIRLIYGEEYSGAVFSFQILIWVVFIAYVTVVYGQGLLASNKQKIYMYCVFLGALSNILFNLILIPKYSLNGAASAILIAESVVFVFMYFSFQKIVKLSFIKHITRPLIATLLMVVSIYVFRNLNLLIIILLSIVIYFIMLFLVEKIYEIKKNRKKI